MKVSPAPTALQPSVGRVSFFCPSRQFLVRCPLVGECVPSWYCNGRHSLNNGNFLTLLCGRTVYAPSA